MRVLLASGTAPISEEQGHHQLGPPGLHMSPGQWAGSPACSPLPHLIHHMPALWTHPLQPCTQLQGAATPPCCFGAAEALILPLRAENGSRAMLLTRFRGSSDNRWRSKACGLPQEAQCCSLSSSEAQGRACCLVLRHVLAVLPQVSKFACWLERHVATAAANV